MRVLDSTHHSELTPENWDAFVGQDIDGHLLQTWAWGELKGAFGWDVVRIAIEQNSSLAAGAQVLFRRMGPLSIAYIPKGPILVHADEATAKALWRAIDRVSRRHRAVLLKVEPEWRDTDLEKHELLAKWGFVPSSRTIQPRRTMMVDLLASEDEILGRMKSKWRYNTRLASRRGVEVREESLDALPVFYELMRVTGERDEFGVHSLAYYRRAIQEFAPHDRVRLLMAYANGDALGGLVVYAFNKQSWYMYGASSNKSRNLMPNHLLQWRAMQWAKAKGCRQYDMWGITDSDPDSPSTALTGVERFKSGFGGEAVRYVGAYDRVYSRSLNALVQRLWDRRTSG